jgi:hypothetical protein
VWLAEHAAAVGWFPTAPGEVVDDVLAAVWQDDDGKPLHPVAYSVGGWQGPILPGSREEVLPTLLAKLGPHAEPVRVALAALPEIEHASEYDWAARDAEERRRRACFALGDEDADAARAFGCLLELPAPDGRREHRYVTDPEWLADRLVQKIAAYVAAEEQRGERQREQRRAGTSENAEKEARRQERERDYEARLSARARNLDLGAALARWQPKLDTDAVKLLGSLVLLEHGKSAAWAYRLCVEQPTTTNKQGKVSVRYPRGGQAERELHEQALRMLLRARSPEDALAVVLRLLVAQRLVDTSGLPGADRQGVYEPQVLAESRVLAKLAARVAPPSVKQHLAEQAGERERHEQAWREQQAAQLREQREKLANGEPIRCECCLSPIESPDAAVEKHGQLVHVGDCEQQWGSAHDDCDGEREAA